MLERTRAMMEELEGKERIEKAHEISGHPGLFTFGTTLGGGDVLAGPDIPEEDLKKALFPTTSTLTDNQRKDIQHLREIIRTGGDFFVTQNTNDFIKRGKRKRLRSELGLWIFTPEEMMVEFLRKYFSNEFGN